jgi:hypothetical protein
MRSGLIATGVAALLLAGSEGASALDSYGGIPIAAAPATGFFGVTKVHNRWMFVTPEGHAFWMFGVFFVDGTASNDDLDSSYRARIMHKYGTTQVWAEQTVKRLRAWGFNTLAEYSSLYTLPTPIPLNGWANPQKMPFVKLMRPSYYGLMNQWDLAPGPFKDLISVTDPTIYTYYRGNTTPDVFDPNFDSYVEGWMRSRVNEVVGSPWLVGFATDDADNLLGFGPSAEVPALRLHPHIGWLVLIANFHQRSNPKLGMTYADSRVFSKYALRDFLVRRYGRVGALNRAWGSTYTTFGSDGGWPHGRGLLDESGRHRWVGTDHAARSAAPAVQRDLDDFLYEYARRYFSVVTGHIRHYAPQHLIFGPATLNGWNGLTHRSILRAAGEYLDVLQASTRSQEVLDLTAHYAGDIPLMGWTGMVANADSSLWRHSYPEAGTPVLPTQEERGAAYVTRVTQGFDATTATGVKPVVGIKLWSYSDSWGDKANWGLVSLSDNAYDGREAIRTRGVDAWGYPTGGEERDYGNFVSAVTRINAVTRDRLAAELGVPPSPSLNTVSPATVTAGSAPLTITVAGANFRSTSVVRVNGTQRPTTFVSKSALRAQLSATDVVMPRLLQISVFTPAPGAGVSGTRALTVTPHASEVIIDNAPVGVQDRSGGRTFTGRWCQSMIGSAYGAPSLYSCGWGTETYRFMPKIAVAGTYDVYVWWTSNPNRSTDVPITVHHAGGAATRRFDQRVGGGRWRLHGRYPFAGGMSGYVEVSDVNGVAVADAVRFVPVLLGSASGK